MRTARTYIILRGEGRRVELRPLMRGEVGLRSFAGAPSEWYQVTIKGYQPGRNGDAPIRRAEAAVLLRLARRERSTIRRVEG